VDVLDPAGVIQDALRQRRLARIDVRADADVADGGEAGALLGRDGLERRLRAGGEAAGAGRRRIGRAGVHGAREGGGRIGAAAAAARGRRGREALAASDATAQPPQQRRAAARLSQHGSSSNRSTGNSPLGLMCGGPGRRN